MFLADEGDAVAQVGAAEFADGDEPDEVADEAGFGADDAAAPTGWEGVAGEVQLREAVDVVAAVAAVAGHRVEDAEEDVLPEVGRHVARTWVGVAGVRHDGGCRARRDAAV